MSVIIKKNTKGLKVLTPTGYQSFSGIAKIPHNKPLLKIEFKDRTSISVTEGHTFIQNGLEVIAKDLSVGDTIDCDLGYKIIEYITETEKEEYVYELLDVAGGNVYYTQEVLSHNCKFLGSSNTLIESEVLERVEVEEPLDFKYGGAMQIYEPPIRGEFYILGVDSAKGNQSDFSTVQVLKITDEHDISQAAVYRCNTIGTDEFAQVCIGISKYYNDAYMMVESNDIGELVANKIWYEFECDRILNCDKNGLGIRATRKSKLAGNLLLKRYMENGWLDIKDAKTLYELSRYEEVTPNVFHAAGQNEHDDTVTSLIWGLYYLTTVFYDKEANGISDVKNIDKKYMIDSDDKPIFLGDDDGQEGYGRWEF